MVIRSRPAKDTLDRATLTDMVGAFAPQMLVRPSREMSLRGLRSSGMFRTRGGYGG